MEYRTKHGVEEALGMPFRYCLLQDVLQEQKLRLNRPFLAPSNSPNRKVSPDVVDKGLHSEDENWNSGQEEKGRSVSGANPLYVFCAGAS